VNERLNPRKTRGAADGDASARRVRKAAASAAVDLGELGGYIGFHLRVAQEASFRAFARETGQHGLKPGQFAALVVIGRNPGIGQSALSQTIARDKSSVTPVIKELQRLGLIERRASDEDRRRVHLFLTGAGKQRLSRLTRTAEAHDRNLDRIVGDAKPKFLELLRAIADALG
jgi:DNA-binding MarR family transcriptional regulator